MQIILIAPLFIVFALVTFFFGYFVITHFDDVPDWFEPLIVSSTASLLLFPPIFYILETWVF